MVEGKLFKTKLCVLYKRGHCPRQNCSFAHGTAELRRISVPSGKRDYRGGDLRDKLDQRLSPNRNYSPRQDLRGKRSFHGSSPTRSLERSNDRKRRKRHQFDGQSDFSGSLRISDGAEDRVKERSASSDARLVLEKQLKDIESDISMFNHQKSQLQVLVQEKIEEADGLTSRIQELDAQLSKEKEECRRIVSKIKKFVKAHKRYIRVQDELKRSQVRLQKLAEQLISDTAGAGGNEEDSSINIVSDGETTGHHAIGQQNGLHGNTFFNKKILQPEGDTAERLTEANSKIGDKYHAETVRLGKLSGGNVHPTQSITNREVDALDNWAGSHQFHGNEGKQKRGTVSISTTTTDKLKGSGSGLLMPPTSMAAHAIDELIENEEETVEVVEAVNTATNGGATAHEIKRLPVLLPPPPPVLGNSYSRYKGEDEKVDIEGLEEDLVDVDIV